MKKRLERTLVFVKADGMKRKLIGEVISRFEKNGLKVVAMKMVKSSKKLAGKHYPKTEGQVVGMGNKALNATLEKYGNIKIIEKVYGTNNPRSIGLVLRHELVKYLASSPVAMMILEGENAVKRARAIAGFTDPTKAEKGTIRRDFGRDSTLQANKNKRATRNVVHVSGSKDEAKREIKLWFKPKEIFTY